MDNNTNDFEFTNAPGSAPAPTPVKGGVGDFLVSFLKSPAGGAAEVNGDDGAKMGAGFAMIGIGFGAIMLAIMTSGGGGFIGQSLPYLIELVAFFAIFMMGFNFLALQLGNSDKAPGDAVLGTGATTMYFGFSFFILTLVSQMIIKPTSFMFGDGPSMFSVGLLIGFWMGGFMLMGSVTSGVWSNRMKTHGALAGWLAPILTGLAFGLTIWMMLMVNGVDSLPMGRMF